VTIDHAPAPFRCPKLKNHLQRMKGKRLQNLLSATLESAKRDAEKEKRDAEKESPKSEWFLP